MSNLLRLIYLLCAIAFLPLHASAMEVSHAQQQSMLSAQTHAAPTHDACGTAKADQKSGQVHMDSDCCHLHPGTLPEAPLAFAPAIATPVMAYRLISLSSTQSPPERPPRV